VVTASGKLRLLVLYGSYRHNRAGIRLARYAVSALAARGHAVELVDAREVGLPMLDRMYKEYLPGEAPPNMEALAGKIKAADGFVFVAGEYNWGVQPGLKNLTDHFLEEYYWRPAAILSYSAGRLSGARANYIWHGILSEMGMAVISSTVTVPQITSAFDSEGRPMRDGGAAVERAFPRLAADLEWWAEAVKRQRAERTPPY